MLLFQEPFTVSLVSLVVVSLVVIALVVITLVVITLVVITLVVVSLVVISLDLPLSDTGDVHRTTESLLIVVVCTQISFPLKRHF